MIDWEERGMHAWQRVHLAPYPARANSRSPVVLLYLTAMASPV